MTEKTTHTPDHFATSTRAAGLGVQPHDAMARTQGWTRRTPVMFSTAGAMGIDHDIVMKLECLQHSGSFKVRGSFNSALAAEIPEAGLIAASGGNHGLAVAYVAQALGVGAEIFVPRASAAVKVARIRHLGASVTIAGEFYDDARLACNERAESSGALNIHPYDAPLTIAGQAVVGLEMTDQITDFDTVLVAVGGGGLVAGLAAALPERIKIVGVEPESSACFRAAVEAGKPIDVEVGGLAADSLGAKRIGSLPWAIIAERVESVLVTDDSIKEARQRIWDDARLAVEAGGAAALAAITSGAFEISSGERVAVVMCGSNTDPADLVDRA